MKEKEHKATTTKPTEVPFDDHAVCDACGAFGAFHFGDRTLCQNCYEGCGSCCPEFGKDDLWASQKTMRHFSGSRYSSESDIDLQGGLYRPKSV